MRLTRRDSRRFSTLRRVRLTIVGCSPAWPNPGGAQSGYLVEGPGRLLLDCGPGVLGRLREAQRWPELDAIAISHFHLDHYGDLVPWAWGTIYGPGREAGRTALYLPPGGREHLAVLAPYFGGEPDLFERAFDVSESRTGRAERRRGLRARAGPRAALHDRDVRLSRLRRPRDARLLGRLRARTAASPSSHATPTSSSARRPCSTASRSRAAISRWPRPSPRSPPRARGGC